MKAFRSSFVSVARLVAMTALIATMSVASSGAASAGGFEWEGYWCASIGGVMTPMPLWQAQDWGYADGDGNPINGAKMCEPSDFAPPTSEPTAIPVTPDPTQAPITPEPTFEPTIEPTATMEPTTPVETEEPTATVEPTIEPTATTEPTVTAEPTVGPTIEPTADSTEDAMDRCADAAFAAVQQLTSSTTSASTTKSGSNVTALPDTGSGSATTGQLLVVGLLATASLLAGLHRRVAWL